MIFFLTRSTQKPPVNFVEYIESNGTQYIDTGFIPNQDTRIKIKTSPRSIENTDDGVGFIPYGSGISYTERSFELYTSGGKYEFNYGGQNHWVGEVNPAIGQILDIDFNKNSLTMIVNNQIICTNTFSYINYTAPYSLYLFALHRASIFRGHARIYYCQIYDNGVMVRDFVPCLDPNGHACMYEKINSTYYNNIGTGSFIVGPEVD